VGSWRPAAHEMTDLPQPAGQPRGRVTLGDFRRLRGCRRTPRVTGARCWAAQCGGRGPWLARWPCSGTRGVVASLKTAGDRTGIRSPPANPPIDPGSRWRGDLTRWWPANSPTRHSQQIAWGLDPPRAGQPPTQTTDPARVGTSPAAVPTPGPTDTTRPRPTPIFAHQPALARRADRAAAGRSPSTKRSLPSPPRLSANVGSYPPAEPSYATAS
jgi:hypothetical protein